MSPRSNNKHEKPVNDDLNRTMEEGMAEDANKDVVIYDDDDDDDDDDELEDATWGDVVQACCVHSPPEWGMIFLGMCAVLFFLYWFLFGLDLLGTGAKVMSGCRAGTLFGNEANPIAGLMIGILCTVLLQSSSTTTSIIVSLVGSTISVDQGIYMIMGANIGTSVTNTIVAVGSMGNGDQLERAFAGAVVHDMFNFLTVAVLLPVEVITGYLDALTGAMVKNASTSDGETWGGPVDKYIEPLGARVLKENKAIVKAMAAGTGSCEEGDGFYPIICEPGTPTKDTCSQVGLIACDSDVGCPIFFDPNATAQDDKVSGGVVFFLGIVIMFICMAGLVTTLNKLLGGLSSRVINKATNVNGYVAIAIGAGITMVVQSSSITTSTLTPLVGLGALPLEQMYPLTLGANIGTTLTALLASLVADGTEPLQVALAHLFFNITGIFIWFPFPFMRKIPIGLARRLGRATRIWRGFPFPYIFVMFFLVPLFFLALSSLFTNDSKGLTVLGVLITVGVALGLGYTIYYCRFKGGQKKFRGFMVNREKKRRTMEELPEDMVYLKSAVAVLMEKEDISKDQLDEKMKLLEAESKTDDGEEEQEA